MESSNNNNSKYFIMEIKISKKYIGILTKFLRYFIPFVLFIIIFYLWGSREIDLFKTDITIYNIVPFKSIIEYVKNGLMLGIIMSFIGSFCFLFLSLWIINLFVVIDKGYFISEMLLGILIAKTLHFILSSNFSINIDELIFYLIAYPLAKKTYLRFRMTASKITVK